MSWHSQWHSLSRQIEGLLEAGRFYVEFANVNSSDPFRLADKDLGDRIRQLSAQLREYRAKYQSTLPEEAGRSLGQITGRLDEALAPKSSVKGMFLVQLATTALAAFRAEFEYHISDLSFTARRLSERAFVHLQRTIMADDSARSRWKSAFETNEVAVERLGAVHLLQHGIWAFKADTVGGRTDLVLGEPLTELAVAERTAEALVLTEWKLVRKPRETLSQADQALLQATRYAGGSLAGFELADYRYLVLVSEKALDVPADQEHDGATYHYVNIAVDPDVPSRR